MTAVPAVGKKSVSFGQLLNEQWEIQASFLTALQISLIFRAEICSPRNLKSSYAHVLCGSILTCVKFVSGLNLSWIPTVDNEDISSLVLYWKMSPHLYDNISFSNTVFYGFETLATRVQNKLLVVEQSEFLPVHKNTRDTSFDVNRSIVLGHIHCHF